MRTIAIICALLMVSALACEETKAEKVKDFELCYNIACTFIKRHSTPQAEVAWERKWDVALKEKSKEDENFDENRYTNTRVFNWAVSKMGKKLSDLTIEERVMVCRFFCLYVNRGLSFPNFVVENVNSDRMIRIAYDLFNN